MGFNVTFRQLRVFEAVAEHGSYTRAAEALYLTQPAVSMQVKQLESVVQSGLFEQQGKKVHLTDAGRILLEHSQTITRALEEAEHDLNNAKGLAGSQLRIVVTSTANYFTTRLIGEFHHRYPQVKISLDVTNRQELIALLGENRPDIVLMGRPPRDLDLLTIPFVPNPLVVIAAPDDPLAGRESIPISELEQRTFIMREQGSGTRIATQRVFTQYGIKLNSSVEMANTEAIKQFVEAGLGLSVVSRHTVELELDAGRLVELDVHHFPIQRHWYIAHLKNKKLGEAASAFKQFVLQYRDQHAAT